MPFSKLKLKPSTLNALQKCGYTKPTPIQEQAIPIVLTGKDLIATAQTGTGKTAAFVLPALELLLNSDPQRLPRILILVPVRELATQITDAIHKYSSGARVKVVSILGGMPYHAQMRQLSQPHDIIVATPGRLIDYLERGNIDLSQIKMFVLDEADRMLDMGFFEDVKLIARHLPKKHQTLLFTATMDEPIKKLAQTLLHEPEHIAVLGTSVTLDKIKQIAYIADDMLHKNKLLAHLLANTSIYKAIIFAATKRSADKLSRDIREQGYHTNALHGDIKQQKRNNILRQFRTGQIQFLVATDVAARGIDISDITHVINYDIPRTGEDYVHRIGRTGRAGKEGIAISFISASEAIQLKRIERTIGMKIPQEVIPGLEAKRSLHAADKPKKVWQGRGRGRGSNEGGRASGGRPSYGDRHSSGRTHGDKPAHARTANARSYSDRNTNERSAYSDKSNSRTGYSHRKSTDGTAAPRPRHPGERTHHDRAASPRTSDGNRNSSPRTTRGDRPHGRKPGGASHFTDKKRSTNPHARRES